jgi:dihydrofolate synthase/folylpolyglutamate synthase
VIDSVEAAAAYLDGLINRERSPGGGPRVDLEPVRRLLAAVGDPQQQLSVLHVAGSKGKGSVCLLAESLLRAAGERVGTFTSPHLSRWTERFRIDGREVEGEALAAAVERLRPVVEALRDDPSAATPSFFDATTAAALMLFADARVDRVALEVGLGGRLDSTNVVDPAVTAVTSIELEHTEFLGDTLAAIAGEKAGILAPGVPCVTGRLPAEAARVVQERACELSAPLYRLGREFEVEVVEQSPEGLAIRYSEPDGFSLEARLPVLGAHHADNGAIALAAVRRLEAHDPTQLAAAAERGFANAQLAGRVECVERDPCVIVDGAHTEASARALVEALAGLPHTAGRFVVSISAGKDLDAILRLLLPLASELWVTRAEPHRSADPAEIAQAALRIAPGIPVEIVEDPQAAVRAARERTQPGELLCVTGSVYLAGIARSLLVSGDALGE